MTDEAVIAAAMQRMWTQYRSQMEERAAVLKDAAVALAADALNEDGRRAAEKTAHTLAGTLGTFGLADGTTLAREAETLLAAGSASADKAARLGEIAAALAAMIVAKA